MKKRIIMGSCAVLLAVAAIVGTKANPPLPDYYINDDEECVEAPITNCVTGGDNCDKTVSGQTGLKQFYDQRNDGDCEVTLKNP